jgi:hypothetical protein
VSASNFQKETDNHLEDHATSSYGKTRTTYAAVNVFLNFCQNITVGNDINFAQGVYRPGGYNQVL